MSDATATHAEAPRLHFALQAGAEWSTRLHAAGVSDEHVTTVVTEALASLLAELGVPAFPELKVAVSAADGSTPYESAEPRLFLDARPLHYPDDLAARVTGDVARFADEAAALASVVREIVRLHATHLVTAETAAAFLETGNVSHVMQDQRAVEILRRVLACGLDLTQRQRIASTVVESVACGLGDDDIVESIITRLRPATIDVEIDAAYLRTIAPHAPALTKPRLVRTIAPEMAAQAEALEQALLHDLGVRLPPVRLVPRDDVPAESFIVRINNVPGLPWRGLRPGEYFVNATGEYLETLGIAFIPRRHPSSGVHCGVVTEESLPRMSQLGVQQWDALSHLLVAVGGEARRHAGRLIDADSVVHELALIGSTHADIVDAALARVTIGRLTAILRILLAGGVPVRDLRGILERVIAFDYAVGDDEGRLLLGDALVLERNTTRAPVERAETFARYIRKTLARVITGRAAPDGEVLPVFLMGWEAEQPLLSHLTHRAGNPGGSPLTSNEIETLHEAIRQTIEDITDVTRLPPIVTNASVAELLREAIAPAFPHMTVLSFEDLTPNVSLSTLKRITPP